MKQFFYHILLTVALGCIAGMGIVDTHAQVPTRFNHQAVVRDTLGQLMANRTLSLRISLEQTVGGASVVRYRELHQVTTNANGLFTLEVGGGTVEQGQMDSVNWSAGSVFLRTEVDPAGGQSYVLSSHRELLSVPYALHARNAPVSPQAGQMNYWNGSMWETVPPGGRGQSLIMCDGVPTWGGCIPDVTTMAVTSIFADRASCGGMVVSDGGSLVTVRGVAYGTATSPITSGSVTTNGSGTGTYTSTLTGLSALTTYFARAYATNSVGTAYGNEVTFTTTAVPAFTCGTSSITDVDGNSYATVQIGTQCWTQSNLRVSKYRNGNNITNITDNTQWSQTSTSSTGAWCNYNNDASNGTTYGKLYNWYAVNDSRGLCPTGWHVPTDSEWNVMVKYLDPNADTAATGWQNTNAGTALKSTTGWNNNGNGTNSSGFTGLPGGYRDTNGGFYPVGNDGYWWSSSDAGSGTAWYRLLYYANAFVLRTYTGLRNGFSVRCARD